MEAFFEKLSGQFLLPVVRGNTYEEAFEFCECLSETKLVDCFEITLTTPNALELVSHLNKKGHLVCVGSVNNSTQAREALSAGASFIISAGLSEDIAKASNADDFFYIPGVMTPSEVLKAMSFGLKTLKLFPYSSAGGIKHLKNLSAPFPEVRWMPTGGISLEEAKSLKSNSKILSVGMGSQLYDLKTIQNKEKSQVIKELSDIYKDISL